MSHSNNVEPLPASDLVIMFLSPHLPTDDPLALLDEAAGEDGSSDDSSESDSDEEEADAALFRSDELHNVVDPKPPDQPGKAVTPGKTLGPLPPPRELFNFGSANGSSDAMPLPPRMRTGYAMLYPPPVHRADEPPEPEPLMRNKKLDELVASLMAADAERLQNPALSRNRVAYDVFDPIDLKTNMFVRDDCLNQVLPAIDAPLGEAGLQAMANETAATPTSGSMGSQPDSGGAGGASSSGRASPRLASSSSSAQKKPPAVRLAAPPSRDCLQFESRFESGNLRRSVQVSPFEYDLILRPDLNTRGHTQWFYFAFANAQRGGTYKFNVINCVKPDSLFNFGLLPLVYSTQDATEKQVGWRRRGHDVCYYQNHIKRRSGYYYTLSFKLRVTSASDIIYVAYSHPYTLTDLNIYLKHLEEDPSATKRFRRRPLCETLSGNTVEMLTITSFTSDGEAIRKRKGVVISSRVHPGEANASWMMQGIIEYLTGPSLDAKVLRDNFVFKLVPMLNPDGVVVGNYRCSLSGLDLNRVWREPSRRLTPSIYALKAMMFRLQEDRDVVLFCDLHGHSRKPNVFCYGCEQPAAAMKQFQAMIFPRLLWRNSPVFSFSDCSFKIGRSKETTARVVVHRELGIVNSFTLEATLAGPNFGKFGGMHLMPSMLRSVGHSFCDTILDYFDPDPQKREAVAEELRLLYPQVRWALIASLMFCWMMCVMVGLMACLCCPALLASACLSSGCASDA